MSVAVVVHGLRAINQVSRANERVDHGGTGFGEVLSLLVTCRKREYGRALSSWLTTRGQTVFFVHESNVMRVY